MAHVDEYSLLSKKQHKFRNLHSCETQLIMAIVILDVKFMRKVGNPFLFVFCMEH